MALVALTLVVLDQWTKLLAVEGLTPGLLAPPDYVMPFSEKVLRFYTKVEHPCRGVPKRDCPEKFFVGKFWSFEYHENPGAAWSFGAGTNPRLRVPFFVSVSVLAIGFIIYYLKKARPDQRRVVAGLVLVLGGALGNLIDRARMGYVIDFIVWYIDVWFVDTYRWPTFNVADSAITSGVVLLILDSLLERKLPAKDEALVAKPD